MRSLFQFRLRTLFVVITLATVGCGRYDSSIYPQRTRSVMISPEKADHWRFGDGSQCLREAADAWRELLRAMEHESDDAIAMLTTPTGRAEVESIRSHHSTYEHFVAWAKEADTRWIGSTHRTELELGSEFASHRIVFRNKGDGWKLDEWHRGQ